MEYVKVVTTEGGGSRFVDIDAEQTEATYAEYVPPVLLSQRHSVEGWCS